MSPQPPSGAKTMIPTEALEKEKFIRTYAMDLAALTAQNNAIQAAAPAKEQSKKEFFSSLKTGMHGHASEQERRDKETEDSLVVHDVPQQPRELSDLEKEAEFRDQQAAAAQKEISDELSSLSLGPVEPISIPGNTKEQNPAAQSFIKIPTPPNTPEPTVLPKKVEGEEEEVARESILERLRNKAAEKKASMPAERTFQPIRTQKIEVPSGEELNPTPAVAEAPAQAEPEPVKETLPMESQEPPMPMVVPTPPPAFPTTTIAEQEKPAAFVVKPVADAPTREEMLARLRTNIESKPRTITPSVQIPSAVPVPTPQETPAPFHSFSSDFADRVDAQKASTFSVLAAEKDTQKAVPARKKNIEWLPILAGIVLILGAGTGVLFAYHFMHGTAPVQVATEIPSLVVPDKRVTLEGNDPKTALIQAASQDLPGGELVVTNSPAAQKAGESLFSVLGFQAPDILMRNIDPSSTVGVIHAGSESKPFFLLKVDSYERTFSGMLDWETTLPQDMSQIYPLYSNDSSATQFTDDVVSSHSVRVLRDSEGKSIMLYGYTADKQILIIARDEAAFNLLLSRLAASGK